MSAADKPTSAVPRSTRQQADGIPILLAAGAFQARGASFYTARLAQGLSERGYQPIIICPDASRMPQSYRGKFNVLEYGFLDASLLLPLTVRLIARDVSKLEPQLIHIQSRTSVAYGQMLARRLKLPCVATVHDIQDGSATIDLRIVQQVIAVSESVQESLVSANSVDASHVCVIHNGVPVPEEFDNSNILASNRVPVVGTAGALESAKGLSFFLTAARKLLDMGCDVEFLLAGSGPEEHRLRQQARDLKLVDRVTFVPNLLEFSASLQAMDIFCLPSLQQGLGTVMLEAMALGRPVIASAVGGVGTIVSDHVTGLIVQPSDPDMLASRIRELLSDPEQARRIGCQARQRVIEDFSAPQMVENTINAYRSLRSN